MPAGGVFYYPGFAFGHVFALLINNRIYRLEGRRRGFGRKSSQPEPSGRLVLTMVKAIGTVS